MNIATRQIRGERNILNVIRRVIWQSSARRTIRSYWRFCADVFRLQIDSDIDIWRCKMPKRTPDNCKYINCHGEPGRDSNGKCMGFSLAGDDEPIEVCKRCVYCTAHEEDFR